MSNYKEVSREAFKDFMEAQTEGVRIEYNQIIEPSRMIYYDPDKLEKVSNEEEYYESIIGYMENNKVYNEENRFYLKENGNKFTN